ncbi:MAG: hypothetical protein L0K41_00235 [Yaniella sp.]|uniref:hypothetical protein n=1 Tax=Yaniella sp. TaxID=2773929 RepID=UPI0017F2653D|nr:hypothetical protein [Yaniella sp.]NLZ98489.1 hypothetical protein [Micrococcus sp.]MDN5732077.1 hypothetical protein [Yaniella sp.]MDN5816481.1 hypothetical protein [Yaniella sp.]MDN5817014.1 hypothetical protein [Yaniella sp.]MDN5838837.1 hypothetical protein [Yaniella sp.]
MIWPRILLALALIAMITTMFVPLPLWLAVTLMSFSLISAIVVVLQRAGTRGDR